MQKNESGQIAIFALAVFIVLCLAVVGFLYYQNQTLKEKLSTYLTPSPEPTISVSPSPIASSSASPTQKACTLEAKLCPDGSSVGRTGPNCEFAACPSTPTITNIKSGQKVVSPLTIKGVVPAGWMFEGVFPVKLLDSKGKVLAQSQAKETVPGSWQSGSDVSFSTVLTFDLQASGSGKVRLENDNPSGLTQNSKKFDLTISF